MEKELFKKKYFTHAPNSPMKYEKYDPAAWNEYYDEKEDIIISQNCFRIYKSTRTETEDEEEDEDGEPTLILIHGGGLSSQSWAVCSSFLKKSSSLVAIDLRNHGETKTKDENDLRITTLENDVISILQYLSKQKKRNYTIIGHSVGGAVAIHTVHKIQNEKIQIPIAGTIVIDIVEGTALESLEYTKKVLKKRPKSFKSLERAIQWSLDSQFLSNPESARISIPGQLKNLNELFTWRTDLEKTEKFWEEWYTGISEKFVNIKSAKLLILAGRERLDTTLTIAQMQGKFQMKLIPKVSHMIQEDEPEKTANVIIEFLKKFGLN
eukprot:gene12942-7522_t